jgi:hypothetical protein
MATTNYTTELQKLYVAYFNRPADPAGLAFWNGVVAANGGNTAVVSADFAKQPEYTAAYAGMNSTQIITQVYQNLFSHGPDAAGRDYWVNALDKKIFTIDQIVAEVANGALTTDKTAFSNKVSAAVAFTNAVDTDAEKKAYTGDAANAAAKTFIAGITTDATLAAALTPANLDASVAAVVKAGTAFTIAGGLADLDAANDAIPAFLKTLDLDKDGSFTDTTAADIGTEVTTATGVVAGKVAGYAAAPTPAQKAAILSDFQASLNTTLAADQKIYNDKVADAAKVSGLIASFNAVAVAAAYTTALHKAEAITKAAQAAAVASYDSLNTATITVNADGSVTGVIKANAAGTLSLESGVTETTNPGVTALLTAINAEMVASKSVAAAVAAQQINHLDTAIHDVGANDAAALVDLHDAFTITTPASATTVTAAEISVELTALNAAVAAGAANAAANLTAFNTAIATFLTANTDPLSTAVNAAALDVTNATKAVTDLDKAVIDLNTATGHAATLKGLEDAVTTATDAFAANGFKAPVTVSGFVGATTGTDIFLASSVAGTNGTILTFGLQGKDVLYVGADHTLNAGKIADGKADVLEVFLIQNGANVDVHVETTTFGSATTDQVVVTLAGVVTADLTFSNGIISHV